MEEFLKRVMNSKGSIKVDKRYLLKKIDSTFPRRMSISEEHKHTTDDNKIAFFVAPRFWHYDEIIEKLQKIMTIQYDREDDSYIFG